MSNNNAPTELEIVLRKFENGLGEVKGAINIASNQTSFKLMALETKIEVLGELILEMTELITQKDPEVLKEEFKKKWGRAYNKNLKEYDKMLRQTNPFAGIKLSEE